VLKNDDYRFDVHRSGVLPKGRQ